MSVPSNLIPTRITQLPDAPVASEDSLMLVVYQGNSYKIRVGDLLSVAGVPVTRQVIAGTGMAGGGQLSNNVTLSIAPGGVGTTQLAASGVTPGAYGSATDIPVFTVDATGRVLTATTIPAQVSGYVPTSTQVVAGAGLTGGGPLTGNVTLAADLSNATPQPVDTTGAPGVSNELARADHAHPAIDLADDDQVDGLLGLDNGGTGKSLVANEGAIIWCGADGLYVGPVGVSGQVLQSTGAAAPVWVDSATLPAASAVDLAGGSANELLYQVGAGDTGFVAAPVAPDTFLKWDGSQFVWGVVAGAGTVTSVDGSGGTTGLTVTGGPITSAGTLTLGGTLNVANGGTGATTASGARANLSAAVLGANGDITSMTGVTGGISSPDFIQFDTTATVTDATGRLYYDAADQFQTLSFRMNGGVVQRIGEEQYFRVKCQGAITKGQVVSFAGTLGASGGLVGKAATGLAPDQANYVLGLAAETGANNDWITVTSFGEVKQIDTTGGAEAWVQGQVLYYNPAVTGGLTKTKPTTPNAIVVMAAVVNVGSSNGILFVRPTFGSVLGGTDGNVEFTTLTGGDVIAYDAGQQRWENVAQSTLSVASAASATAATNLAGGAANQLAYQTGASATSFVAAPVAPDTYLNWSGSAFQWSANPLGTVTSVAAGSYLTGGTITTSGTLAVDATSANTADKVVARDASGNFSAGTITAALSGNASTATSVAGGAASQIPYQTGAGTTSFIANGTAGQVLKSNGASAPSWAGIDGGTF
jgi:hypothetical protein